MCPHVELQNPLISRLIELVLLEESRRLVQFHESRFRAVDKVLVTAVGVEEDPVYIAATYVSFSSAQQVTDTIAYLRG